MKLHCQSQGFASDVDNTENLRRIVKRIPMHLRAIWVALAHSSNKPASGRHGREPRFFRLKFVKKNLLSPVRYMTLILQGKFIV